MKKLLSYFYPFTTKIKTEQNGIVELTYSNGRKILDSANANYSYGSLQRILKFGLKKIDLANTENILLLGLGGGSVIQTLREDFEFKGKVTAIEIDKTIIDIALKEFGLSSDKNLEVIYADASEYVKQRKKQFDLLIVDLYIDNIVPSAFYSIPFWKSATELLSEKGCFVFNACIFNENSERQLSSLLSYLKESNEVERFNAIEFTNTVIVGKKYS